MKIRHVPCQADPALCSATVPSWVYRTEVENDGERPIRVIWFEFYYLDTCHGEPGDWFGTNVRRKVLRNTDFVEWYGDGSEQRDGWLAPGAVAACDPNYCFAFGDEISPVKWSFIAVDAEGNDEFAEALVPQEACARFEPEGEDGGGTPA